MKPFDPQTQLNDVLTSLPPSGIRKLFDIASAMEGVISLGIGEPDFITPWHIRNAGIHSLEKGHTQYTANAGLKELRAETARYLKRRFGLEYGPENILITVGGSEAIDLTMRAFIRPGDEVIVPQPSFVCYGPLAALAGAKPVYIELKQEDGFKLTAAALKAALTPRTKLLVLPFPNNPTGSIMTRPELEKLAEVLRGTDVMVLSDEIYGELTYTEARHVSIASLPGMKERTVIVGGFSKAYQGETGIAGYTLIFNSWGLRLVEHKPFTSTDDAIRYGTDIHSDKVMVERYTKRLQIADTDEGTQLKERIAELEKLLLAYRSGIIVEKEDLIRKG